MPIQNRRDFTMSHDAIAKEFIAATSPWRCTHFGNLSEIEAQFTATGTWETLAEVRSVQGLDAEDIASFLVTAINYYRASLSNAQ